MVAVGGIELLLLAILGFGPSILIGAFFLFLASTAPVPLAPHAPRTEPPALQAEPPLVCLSHVARDARASRTATPRVPAA